MKTRLSSTIWLLVIWTSVALFAVLGLAYAAGAHSGVSPFSRVRRQAVPVWNS